MVRNSYPGDWQKRRYRTFKRDGFECQNCGENGSKSEPYELEAHHITPISEGGGHHLQNLTTVCHDCHIKIHSKGNGYAMDPSKMYPCAHSYCDEYRTEDTSVMGSYCSEVCYCLDKAEKCMNAIHNDITICSTCFTPWDKREGICPNCNNWKANVERREELDVTDINLKNLFGRLIWEFDLGGRDQKD